MDLIMFVALLAYFVYEDRPEGPTSWLPPTLVHA